MTVCEWLESIKKLDQLIECKYEERERLIAIATGISSGALDGMPHSNTGTVPQKMQDAVVKLVMLEKEITVLIDKYINERQKIIDALEKLPAMEYGVLHRYYIQYMTYEKIAENMGICTVQVWRIKRTAEKNLEKFIGCN
jgi:hypothetical protein